MATTDGLSGPGTSSYDSNTMAVGDGTWDSDRNSFLLPNLQGLNFATMQYNGMGNRFRDLPQYHNLIMGHGIMAAITFLVIVPAAIFIARFYHASGRTAYKLHVYLQILTVFAATVVLVLGWFAVGPERSLSNPHHGIGVAIYVAVLVQFLYGWWMSKRERKRKTAHPTIPLKVHLHRIFGRSVAILAFVQVALGLTLYGSPKALFILYALYGALVILAYLTLEYRNKPRFGAGVPLPGPHSDYPSDYYSDYTGSYLTGSRTDMTRDRRRDEDKSSGWGKKLLVGAGAAGAYKWWKGRQDRKEIDEKESDYDRRDERRDDRSDRRDDRRHGGPPGPSAYSEATSIGPPVQYGRPGTPGRRPQGGPPPHGQYNDQQTPHRPRHNESEMSPESWDDKDDRPQDNTWRNRLVGGAAGIAAFQGVKSLFGSKKKRKDGYVDSEVSYRPPPQHGRHQSMVSQTDVSRVEAGQAPFSPEDQRGNRRVHIADTQPMTPTRPSNRTRHSVDSLSYSEATSFAPPRRQMAAEGPNLRESIATMGAIAGLRDWNQRRKNRREDDRLEKVRKQELQHEASFNRRNSDRYPRAQDASGRRDSLSDTIMTGPTAQDHTLGSPSVRPDTSHPPLPAATSLLPQGQYQSEQPWQQQHPQPPQPPYHDPYQQSHHQQQQQQQQQQVVFDLPPPPPGPPPNAARPLDYLPPPPGSLQMPQGVMNPDPSRLVGDHQNPSQPVSNFPAGLADTGGAAAGLAAGHHQRTQSESPSRRSARPDSQTRYGANQTRRASATSASISQVNTSSGINPQASPPVSVKVNMHPDGRHVTLRRLNDEEAAAERASRKRGGDKKKTRRNSSLSSGVDNDDGGGRYRRNGNHIRNSSQQPIKNIPPPPAMSNTGGAARRDSELNLPPVPPGHSSQVLSQATGPAGSGMVGSPGNANDGTDMGTGTDLSNFDNNRRRRRAERARRMEAANRGGKGVEFS
ncbi:uncharacterized protein RCC_01403 [Ramularia collo-cygni]|uniref:Cytochrome b561 domain-containing protein n=1 Tax=Ramularia collo-cygni TaxID=112498 RepID=A0A2D3V212_9PEZI|nr:uncharacterized protein RCC_01403 [Ramularia collo-cygni]CZT15549.1 uncharacterized protein RCC_01403 [Ramularia collo-cygni]